MITINDIKEKLPKTYKITAVAALIFGFMAYGYVYLNPMYIHDASVTSWNVDVFENIYEGSARMTPFAGVWLYLQGWTQVPLCAGIFSLFLCGIAAFFVCDYLEIKNDIFMVLVSGIMTVCPALISSNIYGAGGLPFVIAMLFASAGPWFSKKETLWSYIAAIICLFISAATYSSYLQWAACIFIIKQIKYLIEQDEINIRQFIKKDIIYAFILLLSTCMDIILSVLVLRYTGATAQGRVSNAIRSDGEVQVGFSHAEWAIESLKKMILELLPPFVTNHFNKPWMYYSVFDYNTILWVLFFASGVIVFALMIKRLWKLGSTKTRVLLLVLHGVVLFFAMDILGYVMMAHVLMQYAHIAPWILLLLIADSFIEKDEFSMRIRKITQCTLMIMCAVTILYESLVANVAYQKAEAFFRTGVLAVNRIMGRLESIDGYEEDTNVFFVGDLNDYGAPENRSDFYLADRLAGIGEYGTALTYEHVLQDYLSQQIGNDVHYACTPAWWGGEAESYYEFLNTNGRFDGCKEEFVTKYNRTNDLPMSNNYFWFHDILVFRLETQ